MRFVAGNLIRKIRYLFLTGLVETVSNCGINNLRSWRN